MALLRWLPSLAAWRATAASILLQASFHVAWAGQKRIAAEQHGIVSPRNETNGNPRLEEPPKDLPPEEAELMSSRALLLLTSLLLATFFTSYYLQRHKIRIIHESVVAIILGSIVGLIVRLSPLGQTLGHLLTFKHTYFFNLLLPPIILNSGYELREGDFFGHLGPIATFAFAGTFTSILVIAVLQYLLALIGLSSFTWIESLMFGCILSSTDPVTVLAIFSQLKVDARLYSIIFGESILNDSVAIVLFSALNQLQAGEGPDLSPIGNAARLLGIFVVVFIGSLVMGVSVGLATALILKHSDLHRVPGVESCVVTLLAYTSYLAAQASGLSGIVSLLFSAIFLRHYAYSSMSPRTKRTTRSLFSTLSQLSENFIFIYLGLTLTSQSGSAFSVLLIVITFGVILAARYVSVFPWAGLLNAVARMRGQSPPVPRNHQIMLWWAGLRGAVSFALALEVSTQNASLIQTTTLILVILTVLVFGGTVPQALNAFNIKSQSVVDSIVVYDSDDDLPRLVRREQIPLFPDGGHRERVPTRASVRGGSSSSEDEEHSPRVDAGEDSARPEENWFVRMDAIYLRPFFCKQDHARQRPVEP